MKPLTLQFGRTLFSPGFTSSLSTVLIFPMLVYLGVWQLDRYHYKRDLQKQLEARIHMPPITHLNPEAVRLSTLSNLRYRQLQISGFFLNEHTLLLDNQMVAGKAGYRVLTPFHCQDDTKLILIDRGWIPAGNSRQVLPQLPPIFEKLVLIGTINQPVQSLTLPAIFTPKTSLIKHCEYRAPVQADPAHTPQMPLRIQRVDFSELAICFGRELYPFMLQLNPQNPYGFHIPLIGLTSAPERHLGYAIQWFTMALASFIYYCVINSRRLCHAKNPLHP